MYIYIYILSPPRPSSFLMRPPCQGQGLGVRSSAVWGVILRFPVLRGGKGEWAAFNLSYTKLEAPQVHH